MRIALYGGSFNPPHLAHQLACTLALAAARPPVDEVWMVPTFEHAFDKPLAPFAHRLAMCERAARPFAGRVAVSDIEARLGGPSYTLRTVRAVREARPDDEVVVVIGADLVEERVRWHGWAELAALVPFLVIGREGAAPSAAPPGARDHWLGVQLPAVSSTEARRRITGGQPTVGLLDEAVRAYVDEHALYREPA